MLDGKADTNRPDSTYQKWLERRTFVASGLAACFSITTPANFRKWVEARVEHERDGPDRFADIDAALMRCADEWAARVIEQKDQQPGAAAESFSRTWTRVFAKQRASSWHRADRCRARSPALAEPALLAYRVRVPSIAQLQPQHALQVAVRPLLFETFGVCVAKLGLPTGPSPKLGSL